MKNKEYIALLEMRVKNLETKLAILENNSRVYGPIKPPETLPTITWPPSFPGFDPYNPYKVTCNGS